MSMPVENITALSCSVIEHFDDRERVASAMGASAIGASAMGESASAPSSVPIHTERSVKQPCHM